MNLIICLTPLQVLIAKKIIELHPDEEFYGIMFLLRNNKKYNYYYQLLKSDCIRSDCFLLNNKSRIYSLVTFFKVIFKSFSFKKFNKVFIASIDSIHISILLHKTKFIQIETFDDGTANINPGSSYQNYNYTKRLRFLIKILKIKYTIEWFKKNSKKHYTIYKSNYNIFSNTHYISLIDNTVNSEINVRNEYKSIFLGDEPNITFLEYNNIIQKLFELYNIDYYFPHPKEKEIIKNVNYITTEKIFEDYAIDELNKNPKLIINLYSMGSSASLNLKYMHRVNSKIIKDILILPEELFEPFIREGIEVVSVKEIL